MAAKKQTKSKTRTTTKRQGFQFKWWMGLILVGVVAVVGLVVLRFSNASSGTTTFKYGHECRWDAGVPWCTIGNTQFWSFDIGSIGYFCHKINPSYTSDNKVFYKCNGSATPPY